MSLTYKQPSDEMRASLNNRYSTVKNNLAATILDSRFDGMKGSYLDVYFSVPKGKKPIAQNVTAVHLITKANVILGSVTDIENQDEKYLAARAMSLIQSEAIKTYLIEVESTYADGSTHNKKVIQRAAHPIHAAGAALYTGFKLSYHQITTNITSSVAAGEDIIVVNDKGETHFVQHIKRLLTSDRTPSDYNNLTKIIEEGVAEGIDDDTRQLLRANELVLAFETFKTDYGAGYEYWIGDIHLYNRSCLILASGEAKNIGVGRILSQVTAAKTYKQEMVACIEKLVAKAVEENPNLNGSAPISCELQAPLFALMKE